MPQMRTHGVHRDIARDPQMPLIWALRDILDLADTKYGCGSGAGGACTVHPDDNAVRSGIPTN
jgi:aerobic-type carbon monoxide dehydrogenase small subunit (CoxS/CutS family)